MRNLTLEEKIVICKSIVISKIVFQTFITTVLGHINNLEKIQKAFLWIRSIPKLLEMTIRWRINDISISDITNNDILNKIIAF